MVEEGAGVKTLFSVEQNKMRKISEPWYEVGDLLRHPNSGPTGVRRYVLVLSVRQDPKDDVWVYDILWLTKHDLFGWQSVASCETMQHWYEKAE